jgi:hypothetical protein
MLRHICEIIRPLNGFDIRKMITRARTRDIVIPSLEWLSLISYGSLNMPAKMVHAAIPEVMVEEIPAKSNAIAKTDAA